MKKVFKIFGFVVLGITAVIGLAIGGFALFGGFKQEKIQITSLYFEDENGATSDTLYLYGVLDEELVNIKYEPKDATETKLKFTPVGSATAPMLDMTKLEKARANEGFIISPTKKLDGKNVGGSVKLKVSSVNNDNCFCYIYVVVDVEVDDNTIDFKAPNLVTQIDTEVGYAKSYLAKKASNQNISLNAPDSNGLNIDTSAIAKGIKKDVYLDYDPEKISITKLDNNNKVVASVVSGSIINKVVSKDAVENSIDYLDVFYDRLNNKYNFTINPTDKTGNTKITMRMHRTYKIQEDYNSKFVNKEEIVDGNYRYIKYVSKFEEYRNLTSAEIDNMERTNPDKFAEYTNLVNEYNEFLNKYLKYFTQSENAKNFFYTYITDGLLTLDYKKPEEQILKSINFVFVEETIYLYVTDVEVGNLKVGNHGKSNIFYVSEDVKYTLAELISDGIYNDEGSLKYQPFHITIEADNSNETNPTIILENNLAVQSMLSNLEVDVYAYTIKGDQIKVDIANDKTNGLKVGNKNKETNFTRCYDENGAVVEQNDENIWWRDDISPEELIVINKNFLEVVKNEDNTFTFIPKVPTEYLQNLKSDINLYLRFRLRVESAEYGTGYFYDYSYVKVSYKNVSNFTMGSLSNMTINEGESLKYQGEQRTQLLTSTTINKEDSPYNQVYYFVESKSNIKDADKLIYHLNVLKDKSGKAIEFGFLNLEANAIDSVLEDNTKLKGHLICIPDDEEPSKYIFNKMMALNITGSFNGADMIENPVKVFAVVLLTDRDGNPITNMGERIDLLSQEIEKDTDADADDKNERNLFVINYPKSINDVKQIKTEYILDRLYYYTKSENEQPYYYEENASGVGTVLNTVEKGEYFLRNNRPLEVEGKYTTLKLLAEDKYVDLVTVSPLQLEKDGDIKTSIEIDENGNNIDVLYNVLYTFTKAFNNEEFLFVFEGPSSEKTFAEVYNRKVTIKNPVAGVADGEGSEGDEETEIEITDYFNFELLLDSEGNETNFKKNFKLNIRTLGEESGINTINLKEINYSYNNCSGVMDGAVATVINYINVSNINTIYHNDRDINGVSKDQVILENVFKFETEQNSNRVIPGVTTWQIATDVDQNEFFFNYYVTDAHYSVAERLYNHYKSGGTGTPDSTKAELARQLMNRTLYTDFRKNFAVIYGDFATLLDCWDGDSSTGVNTLIDYYGILGIDYGSSWYNLKDAINNKIDPSYQEENSLLVFELLRSNKDALSFDVSVDLFTHKKSTEQVLITDLNDIYELIFANLIFNNGDPLNYQLYKNTVDKENKIVFYSDLKKEDGSLKEEYNYLTSKSSLINLYLKNTYIRDVINNFYPDRVLISNEIKNDYESLYSIITALKIVVENSEINKSGITEEDIDSLFDLDKIREEYEKVEDNESTTDVNEKEKVITDVYDKIKNEVVRILLYASIGTPYVTYHNGYAEYYSGLEIENGNNTSANISNEGQYQRLKNIVRTLNLMLGSRVEINENLNLVKNTLNNVLNFTSDDANSEYTTESGKILTINGNFAYYTNLYDLINDKQYESNALTLDAYLALIAKTEGLEYVEDNKDKFIRDYVTMLISTKVDSSFSDLIIENAIKNVTSNANSDSLVDIKYIQKNEELRKYFEYIDANGEIIVENDGYISFIPSIAGNEITKDDYVMIGGTFDYNPANLSEDIYESTKDENNNTIFTSYSLQTAQFTLAEVGEKGYYTRNVTYIHKDQINQLYLNNLYNLVYYEIGDNMFSREGDKDRIADTDLSKYYSDDKYLKPVHIWRNDVGYYEFVQQYDTNNTASNLSNYVDVSDIFAINNTNGEYYQIIYYIYVGEKIRIEDPDDETKSIKVYNLNTESAEYEVDDSGKYYHNMFASIDAPAYRAYVQHIELPVTVVASFYPYFSDGVQHFRSVHEKEFTFKLRFEVREPVIMSYIYSDNMLVAGDGKDSYLDSNEFFSYEYYVEEMDFANKISEITKYGVVEFKDSSSDSYVRYIYNDTEMSFVKVEGSVVATGNYYDLYLNDKLVVNQNAELVNAINGLQIQPNQKVMIPLNSLNIAYLESKVNIRKADSATFGLYNIIDGAFTTEPIEIKEIGVGDNGENIDINGDGKPEDFKGFYYEVYYNNESIVDKTNSKDIWEKYQSIIANQTTTFKYVVNSYDDAKNYNDSQSYHKIKYSISDDNSGLFDKDKNSKNFKFNNLAIGEKPSGKYNMLVETSAGFKQLNFVESSIENTGYYKIEKGTIKYSEDNKGTHNIVLADLDKVIDKDLTNSTTSKVTYTKYGNFVPLVDKTDYLNAEFARQKIENNTTNQYVVYGNTQIELAELINFEQKLDAGQLIPHIKFKVSNVQSGSNVAYFISGNKEQSEQIGYNDYVVYNRETGKIQPATSSSMIDKVTLYFRDTNNVKYINLDMYLLIGSQEIKIYTYYITVNPSITLIGITNNYVEVNSGQDDIDIDVAIKQVVNEVGTMVNYGEYGYAIYSKDGLPKYLSVNQLNSEDEEYNTGYKIFSTMSVGEVYNRTNETFELIVCYKDGDNWIIPKDSSYKITVRVRPTYMVTETTSESNPFETIYYENKGVSDVNRFDLNKLHLFSINRNTLNDYSINKTAPKLTYTIAEDQNDAVKDILSNITLTDGVITFENPINFDFTLKIKATYGINDVIEEDYAYIKFQGLNFYFDTPNQAFGENNTDKLGKGSLPLDSENGYKLDSSVDSTFLNNQQNYNVTLMANNVYDLRTIVNLVYYDKNNTNPIYVGFSNPAAKNEKAPIGTTFVADTESQYAGISYNLSIPRIYDLTTNKIVIDIYAYIVSDATSRVAYDTGRDLIINVVPDFEIALNNDNTTKPTESIATINGTSIVGLQLLNGKSVLDIENLFNITSLITGKSLYEEEGFNKNEFLRRSVSVGYDIDNMTKVDDKYYIINDSITFTEIISDRAIDIVKLISGIPSSEVDSKVPLIFENGVVNVTKFAYGSDEERYHNLLIPIVIKNNSLPVESQLLNKNQLYIKVANTNLELNNGSDFNVDADNENTLLYNKTVKTLDIDFKKYIDFNFTENGFSNSYKEKYANYLLNIKLAEDYNNNFYKSFVEIKTRKIDLNDDQIGDYEISDIINIYPSINKSVELVLEIEYIFVEETEKVIEGKTHYTYNILDTLSNRDQITIKIDAGYEVSVDKTKNTSIIQNEEIDEKTGTIKTEGINLDADENVYMVYSIYNYQNIFESNLFIFMTNENTDLIDYTKQYLDVDDNKFNLLKKYETLESNKVDSSKTLITQELYISRLKEYLNQLMSKDDFNDSFDLKFELLKENETLEVDKVSESKIFVSMTEYKNRLRNYINEFISNENFTDQDDQKFALLASNETLMLFISQDTYKERLKIYEDKLKVQIASQGIKSYNFSNSAKYYKFDIDNNKWVSVYKYELGTMSILNGRIEIKDLGFDVLVPVEFEVYGGFGETKTENFENVVIYFKISSNVIEEKVDADSHGLDETYKVNGVDYLAGRGSIDSEVVYDLTKNISVKVITEGVESLAEDNISVQYYFNFKIVRVNGVKVTDNTYKSALTGESLIELTAGQPVNTTDFFNKLTFKNLTKEYKIELSYDYYIVTYVGGVVDNESIIEIPCNKQLIVYALPNLRIYSSANDIVLGTDNNGDINGYAILNNQSLFTTPNGTNITDSNNDILVNGTIIYANAYSKENGNFGFDTSKDDYGINSDNFVSILQNKVQLKYSSTEPYRKWDASNNAYVNYSNTSVAQGDIFNENTITSLTQDGIVSINQLDYDVILPIEFWVEGELVEIIYVKVYSCFVADSEGNKVTQITVNFGETVNFENYKYSSNGNVSLSDGNVNYEVLYNYKFDDSFVTTSKLNYNKSLKDNIYSYYRFIENEFGKLESFTENNGVINDFEFFAEFDADKTGENDEVIAADGIIDDEEFKKGFIDNKFKLTGLDDVQFDNDNILGLELREKVYKNLKDRDNFSLYDSITLLRLQRYFNLIYDAKIGTDEQSQIWSDFITMIYNNNDFDGFVAKYKDTAPAIQGKTANLEQELLMFAYRNLIVKEVGTVLQYNSLIEVFDKLLDENEELTSTSYKEASLDGIDVVEKGESFGNYIKSKTYLEGTRFERDVDDTNDDVDKFSSWLETYLDETSNNYKEDILNAYKSLDFNWENFVNSYSSEISDLEAKMYEYVLKNFAISVCGNDAALANLYYYYLLDKSETHDEFNVMVENFYSLGDSSLILNTAMQFDKLTFEESETSKDCKIAIDAYVVEKLTDSKTGVEYYKFINVYEDVASIVVKVNKSAVTS